MPSCSRAKTAVAALFTLQSVVCTGEMALHSVAGSSCDVASPRRCYKNFTLLHQQYKIPDNVTGLHRFSGTWHVPGVN